MSAPEFSIIVPVYNAEKYLQRCLDSLLAQTFACWEAVCVDDGSRDGSAAILAAYAARDARFVILRQENAGAAAARNTAMDAARGKYLVLLDADDWYAPEALAEYWEKMQKDGVDIACSSFVFQYEDGREPQVFAPYDRMPSGIHPVNRSSLYYIHCCMVAPCF